MDDSGVWVATQIPADRVVLSHAAARIPADADSNLVIAVVNRVASALRLQELFGALPSGSVSITHVTMSLDDVPASVYDGGTPRGTDRAVVAIAHASRELLESGQVQRNEKTARNEVLYPPLEWG